MRIFHFTEMAYHLLPPEEDYESVRTTLPNKIYNPVIGADLYHRFLDEWCIADELGLDIMVNEHHQTPSCLNAAAPMIAGILARQTKNARLLVLGNPVANRRQPIRVAEEMAMVDVLSRGRLECGFVKSVPYEVSAGNSNPVRMNDRMWEAVDLILKAWQSHDGPFSFEGRFFHHRMVNIWPRPYQSPTPPVWIASTSPGGAFTVGESGHALTTFLTGYAGTAAVFKAYREGWKKRLNEGLVPLNKLGYAALVYVGENDAEGRAGAQKLLWYRSLNKVPNYFKNPPGYLNVNANVGIMQGEKIGSRQAGVLPDLDEEIQKGVVFCGSPDTVFKQIKCFYEQVGGFGNLISNGQSGFLDHQETVKSLKLLANEVLPRLRNLPAVDQ